MSLCNICPRNCSADRISFGGFCKSGNTIKIARAALHLWEEPVISGSRGAGTVFFSGCNLGCVYCQNEKISRGGFGKEVSISELRAIFESLIEKGAHNIELVTPTHFIPQIKEALCPKLPVPVIYNCGGYEKADTLKELEGLIDIYMPDMKYSIGKVAERYSRSADYPEVNIAAIKEMHRQVGDIEISEDGLLRRGVLVRHLVLPNNLINTKGVIRSFAQLLSEGRKMLFSLMAQYTPCGDLGAYPEINRCLTERELRSAVNALARYSEIEGFTQELGSAQSRYIPDFDLTGIK
ncbi:MAG: 4Fe-4S cluster-binding domain-containing protein [Oscillospiraceae bacterium]|nr:4Fe-4S cluster-binding domain-containing protein [Oscillospiraceae bacterium]